MDCPQLLALGFLLLALAAPQPNIAMSIVRPAEGTEECSPEVTVYRCRDCNSCKCENGKNDFENFEKFAETQNGTFPDATARLVTKKTHVIVCFDKQNSCLQGVYGIFWQKHEGSGLSCGILRYGENGRGDISTKKPICCEADTSTRKYNPVLKCFYTQKSHPNHTAPGNAEFLTSKKNSTGALFAFLFVGVGAGLGTMYYCLRLRRRGQACKHGRQSPEGENLPLDGEPSSSEETSLPAASFSSSLRMCINRLNTY